MFPVRISQSHATKVKIVHYFAKNRVPMVDKVIYAALFLSPMASNV